MSIEATPYSTLGPKISGNSVNNLLGHMISILAETSHPSQPAVTHFLKKLFFKNKINIMPSFILRAELAPRGCAVYSPWHNAVSKRHLCKCQQLHICTAGQGGSGRVCNSARQITLESIILLPAATPCDPAQPSVPPCTTKKRLLYIFFPQMLSPGYAEHVTEQKCCSHDL